MKVKSLTVSKDPDCPLEIEAEVGKEIECRFESGDSNGKEIKKFYLHRSYKEDNELDFYINAQSKEELIQIRDAINQVIEYSENGTIFTIVKDLTEYMENLYEKSL
jgi:hypothetical protein